ncbi:hypothetical protein LOD99_14742 [Oopsacas minuta]|uniref:Uncharacterized protein n=1 Tax=Oopsacas minuta TaxID=111878 RepID=A0AAV7KFC5_9METZ|nr:hypothetical protein LOD99_14742 [Oopsacas minuta]
MNSKFSRISPETVEKGDIVVNKVKYPRQYAVYIGEGKVIEYIHKGNSVGEIITNNLKSFHKNGVLRIRGIRIFRLEYPERVDRAYNLLINPTQEWNMYNHRFMNSETFVRYCTTGMLNDRTIPMRRRIVWSIADKINNSINGRARKRMEI